MRDLIVADGPVFYWRHAEASGLVMEAEVGTDGAYGSGVTLGSAAIYSGGPTCVLTAGGSAYGFYSGTVPALNQLSIVGVMNIPVLSGFKGLISNDDGSTRRWQMRANGADLEFVKIAGGVSTVSASAALTASTSMLIAITASSSGVVKMYRGSSLLTTSSALGGADYGSGGQIQIGWMTGGGGASASAYFSESAIFDQELSGAQIAAYAAAAGL